MRKILLVAVAALATPALAEDVTMDSKLGTTVAEVRDALAAMNYDVRKSEMEDGMIEVYFVRDGHRGEVYVNPRTGAVAKLKMK